jgi:hypothetical protein
MIRIAAAMCALARTALLCVAIVLLPMTLAGPAAVAGVYGDELAKCLVKSTDSNDHLVLIQWMFAALTLHPAVQSMAAVTPEQRTDATKKATALFARLVTENCRKESVEALKYEGASSFGPSFQVLGQVASRDLMTESHVAAGMGEFVSSLGENEKLKALFKDAGVPEKK